MRDVVAGIVVRGQTRPPPAAVLVAFRLTICRFLCPISLIILLLNHAGDVVRMCNYHTRALRHVRKHLTTATPQTIACSVILAQIDYCNSLLYGSPVAVVEKLQRAQNNVARVICQQRRCVHTRPLLRSLQWLPVQQRIQYKIAVITHKALSTSVSSVPPYIDELLQRQLATRSLRSTDALRLAVPWTLTETAKRAFCVAAPNIWNGIVDFVTPVCCQPSIPN